MNEFQKKQVLESDRAKCKRYCKCGHSIVFPINSKASKTICTWCGNYIYKNDLEEFKEKIKKVLKKKKKNINKVL